jgi:hypothetical protein
MLRPDVVEAVREGRFQIYPIATIDQGIEVLTGAAAGVKGDDGRFPEGTINRLVEDKLRKFATRAKEFAKSKDDDRTDPSPTS